MRKVIIFILGVFISMMSFAQTISDIGKIVVGVKILPNSTSETLTHKDLLQNKLISLTANAGFSSYGNNEFYVTPSITINETQLAEGGMQTIYVTTGELVLNVQEGESGVVFASTSYSFKGSGSSKAASIKSGLQKISYGNLKPFFDDARTKILNYYISQQGKIFAKADMYCQNNDFDAAIACLLTIPEELSDIYTQAYEKACDIYRKRNEYISAQIAQETKELNNEVLVRARSLCAAHDAIGTLEALWDYKMSGTEQDEEYRALVKAAENMITEAEQAALEKERQEYEERRQKEEREYRDQKLREEREYRDQRLREERAYADSRREYEDNLMDRRQAHADEVTFKHRQYDLADKIADYERANQREMTEAVKTVAVEYCRTFNY